MSRFKIIISLSLLIAGALSAAAADFKVKGTVTDSVGEPEMYATVKIFTLTDSIKPVSTGVTNDKGLFDRPLKAAGKYRINIYSVGKAPLDKTFEVTASRPVANLGTLMTRVSDNELATVEVVATKPLVSLEVDRIGYDVQADEESKTSMLDELLRKVPMVSVDADGTIKINGSTDFKIYKNGRPNNSYSRNAKEIFKSLPANMIEKIEVITEPGAREDAEGVSAILNIVTMKNTVTKGAMGNISLRYATPSYFPTPNVWLQAQYDKFAMSFYGGLSYANRKQTKSNSESETVYEQTGDILKSESDSRGHNIFGYYGLEGSWEPDTLNLVTFEFGGYNSSSKTYGNSSTRMFNSAGERLYYYNTRRTSGPSGWGDINGSVNYQRSTSTKGESIILSYRLSSDLSNSESTNEYTDYDVLPVPYTGIYSKTKSTGMEHTLQIDWTRPFAKHHTFDIGGKYIHRDNHSKDTYNYFNYRDEFSNFKHITNIGAIFADYRLNLGKFGARAGIRYEFSRLSAKFLDGKEEPFSSNLSDWVPNVGLIFNPNVSNSLKLSFGSRIQRPGIHYLNPAVNTSPNSTSFGNPDLESVRKNSLTLQYNYMKSKFNLGLTANYGFSSNDIIGVQTVDGNHTTSTYENGGKMKNFSARVYVNWRPTTKTSVMLNGGANYNYIFNPNTLEKAHGWGQMVFGRIAQTIPYDINLSLWFNSYISPKGLNSKFRASWWWNGAYTGLTATRNFLKEKRLSVQLSVSNPIRIKDPRYINTSWADGYHSRSLTHINYFTNFSCSVSYRFGKMTTSVKKVNKSIQNDDVMGGNSGGGNGGGN
jgi:hypothetical protein